MVSGAVARTQRGRGCTAPDTDTAPPQMRAVPHKQSSECAQVAIFHGNIQRGSVPTNKEAQGLTKLLVGHSITRKGLCVARLQLHVFLRARPRPWSVSSIYFLHWSINMERLEAGRVAWLGPHIKAHSCTNVHVYASLCFCAGIALRSQLKSVLRPGSMTSGGHHASSR